MIFFQKNIERFHALKSGIGRPICGELGTVMKEIWRDAQIQKLFETRNTYSKLSSLDFLE